jgi:hypothetical protein
MEFFGFRDLKSSVAAPVQPWSWVPTPEQLKTVPAAPKTSRGPTIAKYGWLIYSPVRGTVATGYVEQANPAAGVRGMVLDYDVPLVEEHLVTVLNKMPDELVPQYVEQTLSGNFRLVWVFSRDVSVPDGQFVELIWRALCDRIKPYELHPGLDGASFKPFQRWTRGTMWMEAGGPSHLPDEVLHEAMWIAGGKYRADAKSDLPLDKIAAEIEARWPGKWSGDFVIGARGPRFWDPKADNPMGAMVKPDGFLCFTGTKPVVKWEELLGLEWCRKTRENRLSDATANIYFDGRAYWHQISDQMWKPRSREDTILELQDRGFDNRVTKGKSISDCGRLLNLIQTANRVDAAVSLVNWSPGLCTVRGQHLLNITRVRAMQPAEGPVTTEAFPWLWDFLQGHFAHPEARPLDHFLAWLQRSYRALLERRLDMGQALFLCGPRQNGKTLLATRIVAPLLGEVYADPFEHLTGRTSFNSELFDSYLWCLNDADSPRDGEKGSVLSKIKDAVVNPSHAYHRKFGDKLQVDWVGRLVVTLNDDPASVALLPEVNSNTADKLCFFASKNYSKEWPTNREIEATLDKELPKFARWLLDWNTPKDLLENSRVGVKSYFDPHVLETSRRQSYSYNFRELIVNWVRMTWGVGELEKTMTPTELMANLTSCDPVAALAREWRVPQAARALTTLARDPNSGVVYNDGSERTFTIHRKIIE